MARLEEKLNHASADVEELRALMEQSKIKQDTSNHYVSLIMQMTLTTTEDQQLRIKAFKQNIVERLQHMRDKLQIIKRFSPNTGNSLESEFNKMDAESNKLVSSLEKNLDDDELKKLGEFAENKSEEYNSLERSINIACDCLIEVHDYLTEE